MGSALAGLNVSVVLFAVACAISYAESAESGPSRAVVLLRNGELLQGNVSRHDQTYAIELNANSVVRVGASQVRFVGSDVAHVYRFLRSRTDPQDVTSLLELSQWCLAQRMLNEAADAVIRAMAISPNHPRVARMEQRLRLAASRSDNGPLPTHSSDGPATSVDVDGDESRRALPRGAIGQFTNVVQPLLMNRCATAGCHGPQPASKFQLQRLPASRLLRRSATLANLDATLAVTKGTRIELSPLLRMAKVPHGEDSPTSSRLLNEAQYRQLEEWVARFADDGPDSSPLHRSGTNRVRIDVDSPPARAPKKHPAALVN